MLPRVLTVAKHNVIEAVDSIEKVLAMREMTIGNCENFALKLEEKQFCDNVCGQLSLKGKLYALLCDYITAPLNRFHANDMELERLQHEQLLKERAQSLLRIVSSSFLTLLHVCDMQSYVFSGFLFLSYLVYIV